MSAAGRGGERIALDAYYTPDEVARACVATLDLRGVHRVLEPSVGGGAWVMAVAQAAPSADITGIDINPEAAGLDACAVSLRGDDFLSLALRRYDLVIGNPPFSDAQAHVEHALEVGHTVAFLLRLAFLEGAKRREFWQAHPAARIGVLTSRPSFTGGGTDSAAYGFFVWHRGHTGPTTLHHIDWRMG